MLGCRIIEGAIPKGFPRGSYYTNGPLVGGNVRHPLDGNGVIQRVDFGDGGVSATKKMVTTRQMKEEMDAGRLVFKHTFGSGPRFSMELKNSANTNFFIHAGKGLALFEAGHPVEIDPNSLETLGDSDLGGTVRKGGLVGAHPKVCPTTGRSVFMTHQHSWSGVRIMFLEFLKESFDLASKRVVDIPFFSVIHDFVLSPTDYVMFASPMGFDFANAMVGNSLASCVSIRKNKSTRMYRVPRNPGPLSFSTTPGCFVSHCAGARATADGQMFIDAIRSPSIDEVLTRSRLTRFFGDGTFVELYDKLMEFPVWLDDRYVVGSSRPFGWTRVDTWTGESRIVQCVRGPHLEPSFVGGRWLVGFALRRGEPLLCIADAKSMETMCVIEITDGHRYGLHGFFTTR